jgi:hypothetical protein
MAAMRALGTVSAGTRLQAMARQRRATTWRFRWN